MVRKQPLPSRGFVLVKETRLTSRRQRMIIWQLVRKCLMERPKLDKNAEGTQGGKITGDGINQRGHRLGINLKLDVKAV